MDLSKGMLPIMTPAQIKAASARLAAKGMLPTRTNIAEDAAMMSDAPAAPAPAVKVVPTGPRPGSAAARAAAEIERKRRAGPPAHLIARQARLAEDLRK